MSTEVAEIIAENTHTSSTPTKVIEATEANMNSEPKEASASTLNESDAKENETATIEKH
jgi:hypothetical protein